MKKLSFAKILIICIAVFAMISMTSCDALTDKLPDSIKNIIPGLKDDSTDGGDDLTPVIPDDGANGGNTNDGTGENTPGGDDGSENNGVNAGTPDISDEAAPVVTVTADKTTCAVGDTVTITVTASDNKTPADKLTIVVKVTKDGEKITLSDNTFVAEAAGEYIIKVEVNDEVGNFTPAETKVTAIANSYNFDHEGTEADPFSVANALSIAGGLASGESTPIKYYFTGVISSITSGKIVTFNITDGDETIYCYGLSKTEDIYFGTPATDENGNVTSTLEGLPQKNDTVVLYANVKNHYGTLELTNCLLVSLVEGEHEERTPIVAADLEYGNLLPTDNGTYQFIFATEVDGVKYLMKNTLSGSKPATSAANAENIYYDEFVWEIKIQDGKISFYNGTGYLDYKSKTDLKISTEEVFWNITEINGKVMIQYPETERCLLAKIGGDGFGAYVYPPKGTVSFTDVLYFVDIQ